MPLSVTNYAPIIALVGCSWFDATHVDCGGCSDCHWPVNDPNWCGNYHNKKITKGIVYKTLGSDY